MKNVSLLVRQQIKYMKKINWGEVPDNTPFRLLWGENPQVLKLYEDAVNKEARKINLYPSANKTALRQKLASYNNVSIDSIIPTNGSDEALELIAKVFIAENDEVIIPLPSYPCFESVSQMMGAKIVNVKLDKNFSLDIKKVLKAITSKTKIIWIANPNNPTGNIFIKQEDIEKLVKQLNCIIVFDECYFGISNVSAAELTKKYKNIIVTRSFTKSFALGGARLGYIIANLKTTEYLNRLQETNQIFNVNRFALSCGIALLSNKKTMNESIANFKKLKDYFEELLAAIKGISILPTETTFCLLKLPKEITGGQLKSKLNKIGILIKDCSIYEGLGKQYAYLGVPPKKYQKEVVREIKNILEEYSC